jgi:hypothetical protein
MPETDNKAVRNTGLLVLGYTKLPTREEIKPTAREQHLLELLWTWRQESENSGIVLDEPSTVSADIDEFDH